MTRKTRSAPDMYADLLRHDLCSFVHRSFLEIEGAKLHLGWHIEVLCARLEDVRHGRCKRLIINIPPRHLKSFAASIVFPAFMLGHDPTKKILSVTYAQDLSDNLARRSRSLMMSGFYESIFNTRISKGREAVSDFETTAGGYRLSTSTGGVLTGRGADIIIVDDPIKADDAQSDARRRSVNEWFDNTLRSRLNNQKTGSIIVVMQRLHSDDLTAHIQEPETWEVLSLPAIAEEDERRTITTPYGKKTLGRRVGEVLQPSLLSQELLETQRRAMTDYNFAAQYQQDPQPPTGIIVKRDWITFYEQRGLPNKFDEIVQSWDTANKDTELADFSVCTTWGKAKSNMYLLDVFRRKLNFPELKRAVLNQAALFKAGVVLVEDKASGTSLIQELRADGFWKIKPAPALDGDKIMRLRGQTAKIEGRFALFPKVAPWLDAYLHELTGFPNAKHDDQVDSTVYALAWSTPDNNSESWLAYMRDEVKKQGSNFSQKTGMIRVKLPASIGTTLHLITGRIINMIPSDQIVEMTEEAFLPLRRLGAERIDKIE
jgi:predicted phage terminase large subunit-like protein